MTNRFAASLLALCVGGALTGGSAHAQAPGATPPPTGAPPAAPPTAPPTAGAPSAPPATAPPTAGAPSAPPATGPSSAPAPSPTATPPAAPPLVPAAAPTATAPATGGDGWEKVDANAMVQPGETIPARNLVAAAYGFLWLMALAWIVSLWRRAARIEREVADLRARIEARSSTGK